MNAVDRLIKRINETNSVLCVGIDPRESMFTKAIMKLETSKERYKKFCFDIIDSVFELVPCIKPNIAFFEALGPDGVSLYQEVLRYARKKGLITVADIKRGDIGSTSEAYAQAFLSNNAPFEADFITVNGYFGTDGIKPFVTYANENNKGLFILVKTSNKSSSELQDLVVKETENKLYLEMAKLVNDWGKASLGENNYSSIGAVVGATHKKQLEELRNKYPNMFFLVPGFGVQGGNPEDVKAAFDSNGLGAIINSSRGITAYPAKQELETNKTFTDNEFKSSIKEIVTQNNNKISAFLK